VLSLRHQYTFRKNLEKYVYRAKQAKEETSAIIIRKNNGNKKL
jgi:hypothetical protein